jgi:nicotinamidase-related amidase
MAVDLTALVSPDHTALLTVEVQNMVVGDHAVFSALADAVAAHGTLGRIAELSNAARAAGVPVIHCTAESRPDGLGASHNARLFAAAAKGRAAGDAPPLEAFALHPGIGAEDGDLVLPRLHGLSPMTGTSLDPILRNLGVTTIVATGVSVNVALLGLAFESVNRGYQFVLPRDATAGVGDAYVDTLYANTLSLIATVTTVDAVAEAWRAAVRR